MTLSNYTPVSMHGNIYSLDWSRRNWELRTLPLLKTADIAMYTRVLQSRTLHLPSYVRTLPGSRRPLNSLRHQRAKSFWFSASRPSLKTQDLVFNTWELLFPSPPYIPSLQVKTYKISHTLLELGPTVFYKAVLSTNINAVHVEGKIDDLRGVRI